jgi:hypothetical protein
MIVAAAAVLATNLWTGVAQWTVLVIGAAILVAFVATGRYGFLVPGSITTGLGLGILAATQLAGTAAGGAVMLGLSAGFAGIWLTTRALGLEQHHFWPIIPAVIVGSIGVALLAFGGSGTEFVGAIIGLTLLSSGVALLLQRRSTSPTT